MFEFTGRLKLISIILIVIGAISVTASFLVDYGGHHEEGHAEHGTNGEHHEQPGWPGMHGGEEEAGEGVEDYSHYDVDHIAEDPDNNYHKTAARAVPENNHYYRSLDVDLRSEETKHHQAANMPWANLMVSNFFFLAIALGALFFMAVQYAAQVGWSAVLLRIMEAMASFLWIPMLILLVLIITGIYHIGGNHIWHWMAEGIMNPESENYDALIAGKEGYLNAPFFIIRYVIYFIGWVGGAMLLGKMSRKLEDSSVDPHRQWLKMRNLSAGFLVFFAITSSTSSWDWIMSIDTHWFSTLFGWYTFATMFVSALTALTLITIYLKNKGYLPHVNQSHIHDLGKFMFAFSVFWTYLWFSQFMLIWYSNIPEEVTYYMARFGEYKWLFMTMVALNFVMPILILMSRDSKRNYGFLLFVGIVVLFGHWLDIFIMVMPGTVGDFWQVGLIQLGTLLGFAGLFMFVVFRAISRRSLMIERHPMYVESKHFHI